MEEALRHALLKHFPQFSGVRNKKLHKQAADLHNLTRSHFVTGQAVFLGDCLYKCEFGRIFLILSHQHFTGDKNSELQAIQYVLSGQSLLYFKILFFFVGVFCLFVCFCFSLFSHFDRQQFTYNISIHTFSFQRTVIFCRHFCQTVSQMCASEEKLPSIGSL